MTSKETRKRFGLTGKAHPATRVLLKPMDPKDFNGQKPQCLLVIDDHGKTITPMNTYNDNAGSNYQPQSRPLPGEDRMKEYAGRGYVEGTVTDHPALVLVDAKTGEPVKAKAAAAPTS